MLRNAGQNLARLDETEVAKDSVALAIHLEQTGFLIQIHDRVLRPRHRPCFQIGLAAGIDTDHRLVQPGGTSSHRPLILPTLSLGQMRALAATILPHSYPPQVVVGT